MNLVFLNGRLMAEGEARIPIFDRGFLYGDGVFETVRIQSGKPFRLEAHLARLETGLALLGIRIPDDPAGLRRHAVELIAANRCLDGVLRITVSRGVGSRGYSPAGAASPTVAMTLHPRPSHGADNPRLITSRYRIYAGDPLCGIKSASKLTHVLARAEAEAAGASEALLLNHRGELAETASSNLFWVRSGRLLTPGLGAGALPGVARGLVLELAAREGVDVQEVCEAGTSLQDADEVFLSNVVSGLRRVESVDGRTIPEAAWGSRLRDAFEARVGDELR